MLRIVERLFGDGVLVDEQGTRMRTGYQLSVYREWSTGEGQLVAGGFVVEGLVMAPPAELARLVFTPTPLSLELEDGRSVRVYVVSEDGAVAGADERGIEEART